ncbi:MULTISPECIES: SDR family NAD(P)-dependent oxidoreductase [Streptomyces]|uniref:SDR family NAD(P)-dependent oxidoreductase n=1 Tax=Streptomyces TaxID=1883 RepID=UPI001D04EFC6|nr:MULTISPECIES: SDR family NAD(P)-dependent oxidoreductase [Streptomyces]
MSHSGPHGLARRVDRLDALVVTLRAQGTTIEIRRLDVTDPGAVRAFAQTALDRFGRIDVLVNNDGIRPLSTVADLRVDEWNRLTSSLA